MTDFTVEVVLPSGKTTRIHEINNKLYSRIVKFCHNNDFEGLYNLFDKEIIKLKSFDIIDSFYILLLSRILFIGSEITITGKDDAAVNYNLSIVLDKIEDKYEDLTSYIKSKNLEIELGLPNIVYFKDIDDVYSSVIHKIKCNNITIDFQSLNTEEQNEILNSLPHHIFNDIKQYVEKLSAYFDNFVIVDSNKELEIKQYKINILSNGVMAFLMSVYTYGLSDFYNTMYVFTNKIRGQGDMFFELTPVETKLLINMYREEMESRNKELQKQEADIN